MRHKLLLRKICLRARTFDKVASEVLRLAWHTQDHLAAHSDPPPQNHDQPADSAHHASQTVPGSIKAGPAGLPPDAESAGTTTQDQGAADTSTSKALPLLSNASRDNVLQLIWANFEVGGL